jgi:hypothetical protein
VPGKRKSVAEKACLVYVIVHSGKSHPDPVKPDFFLRIKLYD